MTKIAVTATQDHATGRYRVAAYYRETFLAMESPHRLGVPDVARQVLEGLGLDPADCEANITYRLGRQRTVKRMRET